MPLHLLQTLCEYNIVTHTTISYLLLIIIVGLFFPAAVVMTIDVIGEHCNKDHDKSRKI